MSRCGDIFRYVPQIEQTGLPVDPKIMALLLERDRQLEDYLSEMECPEPGGAGFAATIGRFVCSVGFAGAATTFIAGGANPWVTSMLVGDSLENVGGIVRPTITGYYHVSVNWFCGNWQAGDWSVGAYFGVAGNYETEFAGYERGSNFDANAVHYSVAPRPRWYQLTTGQSLTVFCRRFNAAPAGGTVFLDIARLR